jgi:hypothetical protein
MGVGGKRIAQAALTPGRERLFPSYKVAVWAPEPVGTVRKISSKLGLESQTVQPVANRYTDYAIRTAFREKFYPWLQHRPIIDMATAGLSKAGTFILDHTAPHSGRTDLHGHRYKNLKSPLMI